MEPIDKNAKQLAYGHSPPTIFDIVRRTATQAVCIPVGGGKEVRFRLDNSRIVGPRYGTARPVTDQVRAQILHYKRSATIQARCYDIQEEARKLCYHERREAASPELQRLVLKGVTEQLALLKDWNRALDGKEAAPEPETSDGPDQPPSA